ncbi:hypothetical protein [Actinacidiphila acidipaludis]|uniref:Uncharacterized protein n=1 Tax=Actinacidiphila acidipaludis TaxID=2873382 RepID=A0ABS7QH51_9ACTN|nr:hypothetical protein [Streptomyces acidipaludis]MBY8882288.1 hypothetical protein [Streptomyces acidipaludis]
MSHASPARPTAADVPVRPRPEVAVMPTPVALFQQVRFAYAQLAARSSKEAAMSRVLTAAELDGAWQTLDQRAWLTGHGGPATDWGRRAREGGSVTAWRSFHDGAGRWVWVQVVPLASAEDAASALAEVGKRSLANPRSEVRVVLEQNVPLEPFPGASAVWAHEQHTRPLAKPGPDGVSLLLAAAVGHHVIVLALSGTPAWDWEAASALAARQAARLTVPEG